MGIITIKSLVKRLKQTTGNRQWLFVAMETKPIYIMFRCSFIYRTGIHRNHSVSFETFMCKQKCHVFLISNRTIRNLVGIFTLSCVSL